MVDSFLGLEGGCDISWLFVLGRDRFVVVCGYR